MANKHTLDPEASIIVDTQTLDPESSTVIDSRTLDLEPSSEPLRHTAYRTQANALFCKNLTYQVLFTQPMYGRNNVNNFIPKMQMKAIQ